MLHNVINDSGVRFQIVPSTRKITVPPAYKTIGTVGEHMSEQLTFQVPLTVDGHDIKNCARRFVTWKNVEGTIGHDQLEFLAEDEEWLYFTWKVRDGVTVAKGMVQFAVHFEDWADEILLYRWSTTACTECEILDTLNASFGAYKSIYVAGDTLVFADYTPVEDMTLEMETPGTMPEGTLEITALGLYDVAKYSAVDVKIPGVFDPPTIKVSEDGVVTASANGVTATHQLSAMDDVSFTPDSIVSGYNVFGIAGEAPNVELITVYVTRRSYSGTRDEWLTVIYTTFEDGNIVAKRLHTSKATEEWQFECIKNSPIVLLTTTIKDVTTLNGAEEKWRPVGGPGGEGGDLASVCVATTAGARIEIQ